MSSVKIKVQVEIALNQDQKEKYRVAADKVILKGDFPVRAEVEKDNVYYLGKQSVEDWDLDHYVIGKGDSFSLLDDQDQEVKQFEAIYKDFKNQIIDSLNQDISAGLYDQQIKEKYKKDKSAVKVKISDLNDGRHRSSPYNTQKNHNWIPKGEIDDSGVKIPEFTCRNARTGELMGTFTDIRTACLALGGLSFGNVRLCLREKRATVEGYNFSFKNSNDPEVIQWLEDAENSAEEGR